MNLTKKSWEELYENNLQNSIWPWPEVISSFYRSCRDKNKQYKVLEIGFGVGANATFFCSLDNVDYYGVEISQSALSKTIDRLPQLKEKLFCLDAVNLSLFEDEKFDFVFDRASVPHSERNNISNILKEANRVLKNGGIYSGIDWFAKDSSYSTKGEMFKSNTLERISIEDSFFTGLGIVNFFGKEDIHNFANLSNFKLLDLSYKMFEEKNLKHSMYNFTLQKGRD